MIDPPCTVMVNRILPELKKRTAKLLNEAGWKQVEIAEKMGVTQPMVSRYLRRENEEFEPPIEAFIGNLSERTASIIKEGGDDRELMGTICGSCFSMREKGILCEMHPVDKCRVCMNIRSQRQAVERREVLEDILSAISILESHLSEKIIPEVRINIASALGGAESSSEVAAVPGRLAEIRGEIRALTDPEFGVSRHLSQLLLSAMRIRKEVRSVVNVLFNKYVESALNNLKIDFTGFDGEKIPESWNTMCLVDRGAYGREPCLYVFGGSAAESAKTVKMISDEVERIERKPPSKNE